MNKKYFVKDEALNSVDNDELGHADLANIVRKMIDNTSTPFNIAIIGKWGMGKSSLINIVKKSLEQNKKEYIVAEINAWKYQKDELGKVFLKKLLEAIKGETYTSKDKFADVLNEIIVNSQRDVVDRGERSNLKFNFCDWVRKIKSFLRKNRKNILNVIGIFLLSFVAVYVYKLVVLSGCGNIAYKELIRQVFICYCKNVVVILFVPLVVWYGKVYMDQIVAKRNLKMEFTIPLETRDDYEMYLKGAIKDIERKKIITIIDDLDRLSSEKIVEALDAIKIFMDLTNCIFIVPFDDEILKKALKSKKLKDINGVKYENDSELVLDKLFQYKLYIPEIVRINIKDYAVRLFRYNCLDFVNEYMCGDMEEACRVVRNVIIHNNVKTPRQVKKLINAFINNVILATEREKSSNTRKVRVEEGFVSSFEGLRMIAKISVLQADFNEFYDLLYVDSDLINVILDVNNNVIDDIPEILKDYFDECDGKKVIKNEYNSLIDYLYYTKEYNKKSIVPYLYFAQDSISALIGDKRKQEFFAAVKSENIPTVETMLAEVPVLAKSLELYLNLTDDIYEASKVCITAINVIDKVNFEYVPGIVMGISKRFKTSIDETDDSGINRINFDALFLVKSISETPEAFDDILYDYLNEILDSDVSEEIMNSYLRHKDDITTETRELLKEKIKEFCTEYEYSINDLNMICKEVDKNIIFEYVDDSVLSNVIDEVVQKKQFEKEDIDSIKLYFDVYVRNDTVNNYLEEITRLSMYCEFHDMLSELLTKELVEQLTCENITEIANVILNIDKEDIIDSSYDLMLVLPLDFERIDNNKLDEFMKITLDDSDYFEKLLNHLIENDYEMDTLEKTFQDLITRAMEDGIYLYILCSFSNCITEYQKNSLAKKIESKTAYSVGYNYEYEKSMLYRLYENLDFKDLVLECVKKVIIQNLKLRSNAVSYVEFATSAIEMVIKELEGSDIDTIVKLYLQMYKSLPNITVESINKIYPYLGESHKLEIVNLFKNNLSESCVDDIASFYYNNIDIFNDRNNNTYEFIDFVANNIDSLQDVERAYVLIGTYYSKINLDKIMILSEYAINNKDVLPKATKVLRHFYDGLLLDDYLQLVLYLADVSSSEDVYNLLFSKKNNDKLLKILDYASSQIMNLTKADILVLLDFIKKTKLDCSKQFVMLAKEYLHHNQDVDCNNKIMELIDDEVQKRLLTKKEIIELLYLIYINTSSDELQNKVNEKVELYGLTKKFSAMLNEKGNRS